jgi:hypothetical protein
METLFNKEFTPIEFDVLSLNLKESDVSDIQYEHAIIDSIYYSQLHLEWALHAAASFVENIRKYSESTISVRKDQLFFDSGVMSVSATEIKLSANGTENVSGLMRRSAVVSSYENLFWRFSSIVYITNTVNNKDSVSAYADLVSTNEMIQYYFLNKTDGETLYMCKLFPLNDNTMLSSIEDDRVLCLHDSWRLFFKKDSKIPMIGRTVSVQSDAFTSSTIRVEKAFMDSGTVAKRIFSESGAVTLNDSKLMYLNFDNPSLSRDAVVPDGVSTNTSSIVNTARELEEKKAPFVDWEAHDLRKGDEKSDDFKNEFVQLLLSGNSIPDDAKSDYMSLVSRKELSDILVILGEEIANMDVCDDN